MTLKFLAGWGVVLVGWAILVALFVHLSEPEPRIEWGPLVLADTQEEVACEFDPPISVVISVMHYYDNYAELNLDYMTSTGNVKPVWGWSNCEWQHEFNAAFCDVYTLLPEYVDNDKAMDTIGHEIVHGSCGDYHE